MKLGKTYEPAEYEADIYNLWESAGVFQAHPEKKAERFSISMPPPNETGSLSLGHALFLTLQDVMTRHARQKGKDALWLPGTDHAALPVNAIIEKKLAEEGTNKHEIGREEFLRRTREFVGNSRDTMLKQMRAMGASADWSRLRYTLDPTLSRVVADTFIAMHDAGLIYRGNRIVNWDPNLETNVSDDELEHEEEITTFYTFKYGPFEIGTARPETKFGDKYVVMHPEDKRYKQYKHGDTFEAEWINGKVTATIIKDEAIDMSFGTGVMTITPWHDHTDFEIAERHNLDKEQIIDLSGKLLDIAGEFAGMSIEEARPKIVEKLRAKGLVVKEEANYIHNVAVNSRGKGKIEPQIRLQWFVDVNKKVVSWKGRKHSLKEVMRDVVDTGDIKINPKRFEKVYFHWIDNLRDWCISRQIWWGHRIPVWYRQTETGEEVYVGKQAPTGDDQGWHEWEQDPDTLDTWFSSALWTWSTLIDQDLAKDDSLSLNELLKRSLDYQTYHPTSILETGWDILFFWVARMILATTFMTGQVPFEKVYLHGMVRAEDGKKMSKSRPESIIDPLEIIPKYGTDALRSALIWGTSPGADFNWSTPKIEATRNFYNKLWNIARYIESVVGDSTDTRHEAEPVTDADHWIVAKLHDATTATTKMLEEQKFSEAFDTLYHLVWDDFADWYIEASKVKPNHSLLAYCLETILKLLHPFAPFVTETIWQTLEWEKGSVLASSSWPRVKASDKKAAARFNQIISIVQEARNITVALSVQKPNLYFSHSELLEENKDLITKLARLSGVHRVEAGQGLHLTSTSEVCWLDISIHQAQEYAKKLGQSKADQEKLVTSLEARLSNKNYTKNAPKHIVEETKAQLAEVRRLLEKTEQEISRFSTL